VMCQFRTFSLRAIGSLRPGITLHRGVDSIPAVFGLSDGPTRAGHLPEGLVQPTLEVTMVGMPCI
jgi:hypothetical protein